MDAVGVKDLTPTGEDLVPVGLVPHVPHQLIVWGVEHVVQGHGELHHAQAGAEVPALHAHHIDDEIAELVAHLLQLVLGQLAQIVWQPDALEQGIMGLFAHVRSGSMQLEQR